MLRSRLTRRDMLRWMGLSGAAAYLAGCGGAAAPTATTAPAPKPAATTAPAAPAATTAPPAAAAVTATTVPAKVGPTLKEVEITLAVRGGREDTQIWNDMAAAYSKQSKVVKCKSMEFPSSGFDQKMGALAASNQLPDTIAFSDEPFYYWASRGLFYDLTPLIQRDTAQLELDDMIPGQMDYWRFDNKTKRAGEGPYFGVPRAFLTDGIIFSKLTFAEAKVDPPPVDGNWTWDDLVAMSKKLVKVEGGRLERSGLILPSLRGSIGWAAAYGATNIADRKARKSTLNDPGWVSVLKAQQKMRFEDRSIPLTTEFKDIPAYEVLASKRAGMMIGPGYLTRINTAFTKDKDGWDVAPQPKGPKGRFTRTASSPFCMSATTKNIEESWDFMKYALGKEGQTILTKLGYLMSVRVSVNKQVYDNPTSSQHEDVWIKAMDYQIIEPVTDTYPQMASVWDYYSDQMMNERTKRDPAQVLPIVDSVIDETLKTGDLPLNWQK